HCISTSFTRPKLCLRFILDSTQKMPAAVTYDGVEGGEGGNIFDGIKFWVAQRVPMRTDLLHHIKVSCFLA
ncbi:hypothetical protein KUA11_16955, partial [Acetobacter estunensis]